MWKTNVKTKVITTFIMLSIILMGFFIKSGLPINIGQGLVVISSFCWHINHFYFSVFFYIIFIYRPFQFVIRLYTNDDFRKYSKLWYVVTHIRCVLFSTVVMIASPHWCDPFFIWCCQFIAIFLLILVHLIDMDGIYVDWRTTTIFSLFNRCDVRIIHFK